MEFETRGYQEVTIQNVKNSLNQGKNTLISLPTGAGKAYILAKIVNDLLTAFHELKVLFAVDREILVVQLKETLEQVTENISIGIACSGISKDIDMSKQITLGTRQTIINHIYKNDTVFNLIVADEAHTWKVPSLDQESFQGQFNALYNICLKRNQNLRLFACTATPYSLQSGYIYGKCHKPQLVPYFNELCHRVTYDELTSARYLSPMIGKIASTVDLSGIKVTAGEYNLGQLSDEMVLHIDTVKEAIEEYAQDRKSILIFCVSIAHVEALHGILENSVMLHSKMSKEDREQSLSMFKTGNARIAVSVNILSIGFDHPATDCIILARPTQATSLCLQQLGRGLRPCKGKTNCLMIDMTGNIKQHFPTFDLDKPHVEIPKIRDSKSSDEKEKEELECEYKMCPNCQIECHASTRFCIECNYEFPIELMQAKYLPQMEDIVFKAEEPQRYNVTSMSTHAHISKKNQKQLMKIKIDVMDDFNFKTVYQWICFEDYYDGYAVRKGEETWGKFSDEDFPESLEEGLWLAQDSFKIPTYVMCKTGDNPKFLEVISVHFDNVKRIDDYEEDDFHAEPSMKEIDIETANRNFYDVIESDIPF